MKTATERERALAPKTVAELHVIEQGLTLVATLIEHLPRETGREMQDIAQVMLERAGL